MGDREAHDDGQDMGRGPLIKPAGDPAATVEGYSQLSIRHAESRLSYRLSLLPLTAWLCVLTGCMEAPGGGAAAQRARAYAAALHTITADPLAGARACRAIGATELGADCVTAAAEALAGRDADQAAKLCATIAPGTGKDECFFQVAERSREVERCDAAGAFVDYCRLHRLSADLGRLISTTAKPGDFESLLATQLPAYGFSPADPRPWSAAYRWVLGRQRPLDRASCSNAGDPLQTDACLHTALALFSDRLNHARDTKTFPCQGQPLSGSLAFAADPVLQALLDQRRDQDLCP